MHRINVLQAIVWFCLLTSTSAGDGLEIGLGDVLGAVTRT